MTIETDIRQSVEANCDYLLRRAYITKLRSLLDTLDKEAESIKHIELPLWYLEDIKNWHGCSYGRYVVDEGLLLVREDVDPDTLKWLKDMSIMSGAVVYDFYREPTPPDMERDPLNSHKGPYVMISIGNEVTPAKRYYLGRVRGEPSSLRRALQQKLGTATWNERPKDIGNVLKRHFW